MAWHDAAGIPNYLTVTVFYKINETIRKIPHVNVAELVAAIQSLSPKQVQNILGSPPIADADDRVRFVFSYLVGNDYPLDDTVLQIDSGAMMCDELQANFGQPRSPSEAVLCFLRSLAKSKEDATQKQVDDELVELFQNVKQQKPTLQLNNMNWQPQSVSDFDIEAWLKAHQ